jgi:predicted DNA-binding ribbon-helix-helix protein
MKSPVVKRSIVIAGHKTSVSLEDAFWQGLKQIAAERTMTLSDMVASIDTDRRHGNLSSAIRLFVLDYYRARGNPSSREGSDLSSPDAPPPHGRSPVQSGASALRSE